MFVWSCRRLRRCFRDLVASITSQVERLSAWDRACSSSPAWRSAEVAINIEDALEMAEGAFTGRTQ